MTSTRTTCPSPCGNFTSRTRPLTAGLIPGAQKNGRPDTYISEDQKWRTVWTLQIRIPKGKPGTPNTTRKSKSPSTVRRNQQRMKSFIERKILQESLGSPSARSTPISRPGQTRSSQDIWVAMPVKEALDEDGLEQQEQTNKQTNKLYYSVIERNTLKANTRSH